MATLIADTACVDPRAELADDVEIGPYCVVGPDVKIGQGTRLVGHVCLLGVTTLGENNVISPFAVIGGDPELERRPHHVLVIEDEIVPGRGRPNSGAEEPKPQGACGDPTRSTHGGSVSPPGGLVAKSPGGPGHPPHSGTTARPSISNGSPSFMLAFPARSVHRGSSDRRAPKPCRFRSRP
ncbi:hypothetical protein ACYOEI_30490 [Singulisphaera rosea]